MPAYLLSEIWLDAGGGTVALRLLGYPLPGAGELATTPQSVAMAELTPDQARELLILAAEMATQGGWCIEHGWMARAWRLALSWWNGQEQAPPDAASQRWG
ncbi:hypothetical protein CCR81_01480 [Halorhodospira halophila]|nr:hypothetical protein [Halorhodospira halophila]